MNLFPMFVKMTGRKCVVVGAGQIGASKAAGLLRSGAQVVIVAPDGIRWVQEHANKGKVLWHQREFEAADLEGAFLAVAATNSSSVNELVYRECHQRNVLCNVVDDPERCDFFYPAVVRRGPLQIAVSTGGVSPGLARRLRAELEKQFGPEYASWLAHIGKERQAILLRNLPAAERRTLMEQLTSRSAQDAFLNRAKPTGKGRQQRRP